MADRAINYDRGVKIRQDAQTGMEIFMYKDEPGIYYDSHGRRVKESLARQAGFDVDRYARMRRHQQKLADFHNALDDVEKLDLGLAKRAILRESNGYRLVGLPLGRAVVEDMDGNQLCKPSSKEMMEKLFRQLITDDFSSEDDVYEQPVDEEAQAAKPKGPKKVAP